MRARVDQQGGEAGFTLIETLAALVLTGLLLSALSTLTAQWLPNWDRGIDRIQRSELVGTGMQRMAAELAAAEFVPAGRETRKPLFEGSPLAVTFVRSAIGPNTGIGLDVVRIGEATDRGRPATVRWRTAFAPVPPGISPFTPAQLAEPVVLLRAPLRLSFSYAGPDRIFRDEWRDADKLPALIRLTVRDAASEKVLAVSTVTPIHVDAPARAGESDDDAKDNLKDGANDNAQDGSKNAGNGAPSPTRQRGT
jgi:general secretion pathway protein J